MLICTGIEFDYSRDTTDVTLTVEGSGRFALFVKGQEWTQHLQDASDCDDTDCYYVSVGGSAVWPSSTSFATSCTESVLLSDGTWQNGNHNHASNIHHNIIETGSSP